VRSAIKAVQSIANDSSRRWIIEIEVVVEDRGGDAGANYLGQRWPKARLLERVETPDLCHVANAHGP